MGNTVRLRIWRCECEEGDIRAWEVGNARLFIVIPVFVAIPVDGTQIVDVFVAFHEGFG